MTLLCALLVGLLATTCGALDLPMGDHGCAFSEFPASAYVPATTCARTLRSRIPNKEQDKPLFCARLFKQTLKRRLVDEGRLPNMAADIPLNTLRGFYDHGFVVQKVGSKTFCDVHLACDLRRHVVASNRQVDGVYPMHNCAVTASPTTSPTESPTVFGRDEFTEEQRYPDVLTRNQIAPNIVLVMLDDAGVGDNGIPAYHGNERADELPFNTPALEALASAGVTFTEAYASVPVCGPSRAAMVTGRSPFKTVYRANGGGGMDIRLPHSGLGNTDDTVIFEALQRVGYRVGYTGKWGFCDHPLRRGVDYFFGLLRHRESHSFYPAAMYELQGNPPASEQNVGDIVANHPLPKNLDASKQKCSMDSPADEPRCSHVEKETVAKTVELIHRFADDQQGERNPKPFFVMYSSFLPHVGTFTSSPDDTTDKPVDFTPDCVAAIRSRSTRNRVKKLSRDARERECRHVAMVEEYIDANVGLIVEALEQRSLMDDTVIIVTSDNGPARLRMSGSKKFVHDPYLFNSNGGERGIKREVYEGGVRVPLIIHWRNHIEPAVIDRPTLMVDLYATIAHLANLQEVNNLLNGDMESLSLVPSLMQRDDLQLQHPFLEYVFCNPVYYRDFPANQGEYDKLCNWAIREGDLKLVNDASISKAARRLQLFDLTRSSPEARAVKMSSATRPLKDRLLDLVLHEQVEFGQIELSDLVC